MQLGKKLSILRLVAGYSQREVGRMIHITGSAYGKLERDEILLTTFRAQQFAAIHGVDVNWILCKDKFAIILQTDDVGNLSMKILDAATQNAAATEQALKIALEQVKHEQNLNKRLTKLVEAALKSKGEGKVRRQVRKTKSRNRPACKAGGALRGKIPQFPNSLITKRVV